MGFLDKLNSVVQKGINNMEKLAEEAGREWEYTVRPELNKQSKIAKKKINDFSENAANEWEKTIKPNLIIAGKETQKQWNKFSDYIDDVSQEIKGALKMQWDKIWDSKLGSDINKYPAVKKLTKEDVEAAGKIFAQILGHGTVAYVSIMALTTWLPGVGIPVSGAVLVRSLTEIARVYPQLPEDEQKKVQRVCSWIRFAFTGIPFLK